jgi:hypothetical protein
LLAQFNVNKMMAMSRAVANQLLIAVFGTLVLSCLLPCAHAQVSLADIRAYTEWAASTGEVRLRRPLIEYEGNWLWYCFNDTLIFDLTDPNVDPILIPLNEQFTVTAIRTYRNTERRRRFWRPVLRQVETEISEMLRLINDGMLAGEDLRIVLLERSARIADIYFRELDQLAIREGRTGAERAL